MGCFHFLLVCGIRMQVVPLYDWTSQRETLNEKHFSSAGDSELQSTEIYQRPPAQLDKVAVCAEVLTAAYLNQ